MNGKHILLVDDDNQFLITTQRILIKLGYTVVHAHGSLEAMEIFRNQPAKFDLIVTDLLMPGMNGDMLALSVREIRKDIPVIICSGSEKDLYSLKERGLEKSRFLLKPFSRGQIVEAMNDLGV